MNFSDPSTSDWLAHACQHYPGNYAWNDGATHPKYAGWYERCFKDGIYTHWWDGEVWHHELKDSAAHWHQVGAYPAWRECDHYPPPRHGWCCFHCGDRFPNTDQGMADAREHFGPTPDWSPLCIERRTVPADDVLLRMRKAEEDAREAMTSRSKAMEAQEVAEYVAAGAKADLNYATSTEVRNTLDFLRGIRLSHDLLMAELHRRDPALFQAIHVAAIGPGEYFPPSKPA